MVVTINTDAAYHYSEKLGTYAFSIVCDEGRIKRAGVLKISHDPKDAEIQAIGNALYTLLLSGFKNVKFIVVNTDCTHAILAIRNGKYIGKSRERIVDIHRYISALRIKYQIKGKKKRKKPFIDWRHVKAHSDKLETNRQKANDWCDKAAKEKLWEHINSKKDEKKE